jgi:pimeloyl-ACP methyl ester carboxylesterase
MIRVRWYEGDGPLALVLHGGPGAPGSAAGLARALAGSFRVGEPLQRRSGHGRLTVARHVADLAEVVARCPEAPALVGHSWGAMLALAFAAEHPERVRTLALVGCGTFDPAARAELGRRREARMDAAFKARLAAASFAERGALMAEIENVDPLPGDAPVRADARGHRESWQDLLRLQAEGRYPAAFTAYPGPTLMIHGADDPHPGRMIRDTLHAVLPQIEYVELACCGHEPWREREAREGFLAELAGWLRRGALEAP